MKMRRGNRYGLMVAAIAFAFGCGGIAGSFLDNDSGVSTNSTQPHADEVQATTQRPVPPVPPHVLDGQKVLVFIAPGAAHKYQTEVTDSITKAGGQLAGVLSLAPTFVDSNKLNALGTVATSELPRGCRLPEKDLHPGTAAGTTLGCAFRGGSSGEGSSREGSVEPGAGGQETPLEDRLKLFRSFRASKLLTGEFPTMATAAVVVTGNDHKDTSAITVAKFASGLQGGGLPTVIVGPQGSDKGQRVIAVVNTLNIAGVQTVNDIDTPAGHAYMVLALSATRAQGQEESRQSRQ